MKVYNVEVTTNKNKKIIMVSAEDELEAIDLTYEECKNKGIIVEDIKVI